MTLRFLSTLIAVAGVSIGAAGVQPPATDGGAQPPPAAPGAEPIGQIVDQALQLLKSDDSLKMRQGREMLSEPLRSKSISVTSRQEYSAKLIPALTEMAAKTGNIEDKRAINAALIAGEVATPESTALLIKMSQDSRIAVRHAACTGMSRSFVAMNTSAPAMVANHAQTMVVRLGEMVERDADVQVVDVAVRALGTGMGSKTAEIRNDALTTLSTKAGERLKKLGVEAADDQLVPTMLRAVTSEIDALRGSNSFSNSAMIKAAELARHSVDYVGRNIKALLPRETQNRKDQEKMLNDAESLINVASSKIPGAPAYTPQGLGNDFALGSPGERAFNEKYVNLGRYLRSPPYNMP